MLYVPILKWKQGEKDALSNLSEEVKEDIVPLIELTPDVLERGENLNISRYWERMFYYDTSFESAISDDEFVSKMANCDSLENLIPVIKFDDSYPKIQQLFDLSVNGCALRLSIENCMDDSFNEVFEEIQNIINLNETDLILDVKEIDSAKINEKSFLIVGTLNNISRLNEFRNIILSTNSFPNTLTSCPADSLTVLRRVEKQLYDRVVNNFSKCPIIYSDYSINHWSYFEFIPGIKPSFNIRYTTAEHYLIFKGKTIQKGGLNIENVQYACEQIFNHPFYSGRDFSWGDTEIYNKANEPNPRSGNLTTWRAIGTNHHITLVVNQLSNQLLSLTSL